ncbi:hypothetical protein NC651_019774 [Populus alba x Populus x berolinensis]|nr:hypothetical protein NC651_019774 [Populus alba x Populus x berolinensis]
MRSQIICFIGPKIIQKHLNYHGRQFPHLFGLSLLTIAIISTITASAGLLIYHFIVVLWCHRSRELDQIFTRDSMTSFQDMPTSFENSIASLIPTCKHTNDTGRMMVKKFRFRLNVSHIPCLLYRYVAILSLELPSFVGPTWVSPSQPAISQNPTPLGYRVLVNHREILHGHETSYWVI